ncbi:TonB-dependent receptor [Sphingomonas psychrotolerans]|uniref:TonB-dependent receptor n=1 Tax=Sphingomonas psychrotolerans TaxID=1327635 RepID=A0ABU3N7Y8_9SPHN|nr:TonB-dependent receptor [Sphingomonas psychrotolerans]MDT8760630.1 TonB-dependent receptor [Sphingomonas psychrotolerans]
MVKWGCAIGALMVGALPMAAQAQDQTAAAPQSAPPVNPTAAPDPAQPAAAAQEEEAPAEDIVVTGQLRGAVPGDVKPEVQLGPAEIRAYGASNVTELMNALSAQLGSGSGRGDEQPVILLSGRRSSLAEIRNLPTEAIERMDILPEEAALQFGYGANQKVVNFVLRRRFQALTTVFEGAMPTAGGNAGEGFNANLQKISRNERLELDVKYGQNSGLLESERGVTRAASTLFDTLGNVTGLNGGEIDPALSAIAGGPVTVAGVPAGAGAAAPSLAGFAASAGVANVSDLTPYRTLSGGGRSRQFGDNTAPLSGTPQKNFAITGTYVPAISDKVSAVATVGFTANHSDSLLGLPNATLRLPAGNPFSPFANDVQLYRYYDNLAPLARSSDRRAINANLSVNGTTSPWLASWNWSLQAEYQYNENKSVTETGIDTAAAQARLDAGDPAFNPFGPIASSLAILRPDQISKSQSNRANVDFATYGALFKLPAGDVRATVRVAGRTEDQHSVSLRTNRLQTGDIARDTGSIRANLVLPIASRRNAVLDAIGDLSVTGNVEVEQLSDFGRLTSTTWGLNWSPIPQVRANVSVANDSNAPAPGQLGDPVVVTPNQRVFDFVRNESVDITAISGGNPLLRADDRRVFNARVNIRPLTETNLNINASYSNARTRNATLSFPGASAEVEAAFPDRFVRDTDGRLLSVDYRPINVDRQERSQFRWGIDLSIPISSPQATRLRERRTAFQAALAESRRTGQPLPPEFSAQQEQFRRLGQQQSLFGGNQRGQGQRREGQPQGDRPAGAEQGPGREGQGPGGGGFRGPGGGGRGFGGGGRGGFGGGGNVVRFTLNHTWTLRDEIRIRPGLPEIDRLDGTSAQGTAAHQIDALAAVKRDAWLLQATGAWQSGWRSTTGAIGSETRLNFGSLATVGLLAEFNPGQDFDFLHKHPWFRGSRVQLRVENLFDARQRVTDANGEVPAAYAPNLVDPLGRVVRLTFRKQFF